MSNMQTKRILILEDDLKTLSVLLDRLFLLEQEAKYDFAVTVLSEYMEVENYINQQKNDADYDIILLDRDCKACGSFHVLDFNKFNLDKFISISSVPDYNEQAKAKGITKIVHKDYEKIEEFGNKVLAQMRRLLMY